MSAESGTDLGTTMQTLYERFGTVPGIRIELYKELLAISVDNHSASATIYLQGAQLASFQPKGERDILWCSDRCDFRAGTPLRGGVPVCWPWFGQLDKNPATIRDQVNMDEAPAHGFVRAEPWQVEDIQSLDENTTRLTLSLSIDADDYEGWPYAARLTMQFDIGRQLAMTLGVENRSAETLNFSAALHSYFAISDIADIVIDGLDQLDYIDCLQDWALQQQQGSLTIDREIDRIYHGVNAAITLLDQPWQRALDIRSRGSSSCVIWNPWIEKAKRLSNFADDDYRSMVCIETTNADRDSISLAPSQQHFLTVQINSRSLN